MAHDLAVWLRSHHVGTLSLHQGRMVFRYTPEAIENPAIPVVSVSLPKVDAQYSDRQTRPFFAGLLPEGHLRELIGRQIHVSRQNEFALLKAIGGECAGAVSILPIGVTPHEGQSATQWLSQDALVTILDELPLRPMMVGMDGIRLSLAGAQDKLPVCYDGERIGLPLDGSPSTHILKPAIRGVAGSVINEAYCMRLASAMGLPVASVEVALAGQHEFLLVERYDRVVGGDGKVQRLHQEDLCQASGVVSEIKYQNEGGPGFTECFALLRDATRPSAPNVLALLDYAIFNALVGNHDAHAKNFSLLHRQNGKVVLAPMYDVLSTAIYPSLTPKMAMKLGGRYKFTEVTPEHWHRFADNAGLGISQVTSRAVDLAGKLPEAADSLAKAPLFSERTEVAMITEEIRRRCDLTLKRLAPATSHLNQAVRELEHNVGGEMQNVTKGLKP